MEPRGWWTVGLTAVAGPLGADFHIGLDPAHFDRIAPVVPPPPLPIDLATLDLNSPMAKTFMGPAPGAEASWTSEWRRADIGAANGHGNARSVARVQSVVSHGGEIDGHRFLSADTLERIFEVQADGTDLVLGMPVTFGMGYGLPNETVPHLPLDERVCFWGGWGGSSVVNFLDRRMTVTYMMNRMAEGLLGDDRGFSLVRAAMAATD